MSGGRDGDRPSKPVVAMVGGGQLARMTHQAAIALGQSMRVLAASADEPAPQVCSDVVLGDHNQLGDLRRAATGANALTFDHEGVPTDHLLALQAEGVTINPPPQALQFAQDKLKMRRRLAELNVPIPGFATITSEVDVRAFWERYPGEVVIKAVRGGYDGRGVWLPDSLEEAVVICREQLAAGTPLMAEQRVELARELSAMVGRSAFGQGAAWPVVETVQRRGQCAVALAPAPALSPGDAAFAQSLALRLADVLGVIGVMAVELFQSTDGELLVNELAMRPHNSGHWSMNGSVTSQFEQHVRAVLDYPLGDTAPTAPLTVMANVLGAQRSPAMSIDERLHHLFARMPDVHVHMYGKAERPDRKIGHVNVVGAQGGDRDDPDYVAQVRERAERAAHWMSTGEWTDGWSIHGSQ